MYWIDIKLWSTKNTTHADQTLVIQLVQEDKMNMHLK